MQSAIEYIKALQDLVAQKSSESNVQIEQEEEEAILNVPDRVTSPAIDVTDGATPSIMTSPQGNLCDFLNNTDSFPSNGFLESLIGSGPAFSDSALSLDVSSPLSIDNQPMTSSPANDNSDAMTLSNDLENIDPTIDFSPNHQYSAVTPCSGQITQRMRTPLAPLSIVYDESSYESSYYDYMR